MSISSEGLNNVRAGPEEVASDDPIVNSVMQFWPDSGLDFKCIRLKVEFQWFLIALSVLPGRSFAIDAHLFPCTLCASRIARSSSSAGIKPQVTL